MAILTCADRDPIRSPTCGPRFEPPPAWEILAVPRVVTSCSQIKHIGCQTDVRDSCGPQRLSGALANHHQRRRPESPQNQIYVVPQNQAKTMNANTEPNTAPKLINGRINGRFAPGVSGNPGGSPEATRRAFNKRFLLDLAEDWQQHGREVFKRVRRESPAAYLKVCAMLVPREMKLEHSGGVKAMTDEQLERSIALIEELLAKREAEANAKVIEGEAEVVPSLPAPGSGGTKMPKA